MPYARCTAVYGGVPMGRLIVQAGFFLMFSLLQYCGWQGLSCLLKNETNLLPRYQSRGKLFAALWRFLLPTDLLFVLVMAVGILTGFCGSIPTGIQLVFLVRLGEERTAMTMTACAVGMALISLSPVRFVWLAPAKTPFPAASLIIGICLAAWAALMGKNFTVKRRELPYGNPSARQAGNTPAKQLGLKPPMPPRGRDTVN